MPRLGKSVPVGGDRQVRGSGSSGVLGVAKEEPRSQCGWSSENGGVNDKGEARENTGVVQASSRPRLLPGTGWEVLRRLNQSPGSSDLCFNGLTQRDKGQSRETSQ